MVRHTLETGNMHFRAAQPFTPQAKTYWACVFLVRSGKDTRGTFFANAAGEKNVGKCRRTYINGLLGMCQRKCRIWLPPATLQGP